MREKKRFWGSPFGTVLLGVGANATFWGLTAAFGFLPTVWGVLSKYAPLPLALLAATLLIVEIVMRRRAVRQVRREILTEVDLEAIRKAARELVACFRQ